MSKLAALLPLLLLLTRSSIIVSCQAVTFASRFPQRLTLRGGQIDGKFDPMNSDYQQSLIVVALFGGVCSLLTIAYALLFPLLRSKGCCGGSQPTYGWCCKWGGAVRKKLYPTWQLWSLRIVILVLLAATIGVAVLGITGNGEFDRGFEVSRSSLRDTANGFLNQTLVIQQEVRNLMASPSGANGSLLEYLRQVDNQFTSIIESQGNLSSTSRLVFQVAYRANCVRFYVLTVVLVLAVVLPFLLCLASIGNWKYLSELVLSFGYYVVIFSWLAYTLHFVVAFGFGDFCVSMRSYVSYYDSINNNAQLSADAQRTFLQAKTVIDQVMNCKNNTFVPAFESTQQAVDANIKTINDQLNSLAQSKGISQTYNFNVTNLDNILQLEFVRNDTNTNHSFALAISNIRKLIFIADSLISAAKCYPMFADFQEAIDVGCGKSALQAIDILWMSFLALAVTSFLVVQVAHLAYKRFRKRKFVIPQPLKSQRRGITVYMALH